MKKLLIFICVLLFAATNSKAQYVNIPDSNFRNVLIAKYPSCFNSAKQMDTTCNAIISEWVLIARNKNITNFSGIKYFKKLTLLNLGNNKISSITELPDSLNALVLDSNLFTNFPQIVPIKSNLTTHPVEWNFSNNQIHSILFSIKLLSISYLILNNNGLTYMNDLPNTLEAFVCDNNLLTSLPELPFKLKSIGCLNNNIYCLPPFANSLQTIYLDSSKIKCLPTKIWNAVSVYPGYFATSMAGMDSFFLLHLPVCNPTNDTNLCHSYPQIQSRVFIDYNSNGVKDANEFYMKNVKVQLSNSNYTFTNSNGIFQIASDSIGPFNLTIIPPNFYTAVPATINLNFNSYDTLVNLPDIALQPNVLKDSISVLVTPNHTFAVPGFQYIYNVQYENVGTTVLSPNINFNYDNSLLTYDLSSNAAVVNNGNALSLAVGNLVPGQSGRFIAYFTVKPTAALGTSLLSVASINAGSCNAVDSVTTTVRGSYDPNDKTATPTLTLQEVNEGKNIEYTIHFQNTGTDTARTVVIADTLSALLNSSEIQIVAASNVNSFTTNGNIVYCKFSEINLPDSNVNKTGSCGFITFRVPPISTVAAGTIIPNKAYIYFDYNTPVKTNIVTTTIINPLPLTLLNFTATLQDLHKIFVSWKTVNEINTKYFVIEQSIDGIAFNPSAELAAKGIGNNSYTYSISQTNVVYIRLKMVDRNGTVAYSNIIKLDEMKINGFEIVTNPAKNYLTIKVNANILNNTKAVLATAQGFAVKTFILKQGLQIVEITNLPNGVYYLQTRLGSRKIVVEK